MLYDLNEEGAGRTLAEQRFDVCIAGAGVAGITIALRLADSGRSVLLLEGGGYEISPESQLLYDGRNVGREYFDLQNCRLRFLGGTSNHWSGLCRTLDAFDFVKKEYIPYSGWPIRKSDIAPYEDDVYDILDISERQAPDIDFEHSEGALQLVGFAYSSPTRFRDKYYESLKTSPRVHLVLNANVVDIRLADSLDHTEAIVCRSHRADSEDHHFRASRFVLAMGGIENPRVLLNAGSQIPHGIGNEHDLVGRFFTEHPHFELGKYWQNSWGPKRRFIAPSPDFQRRHRIANCSLRLTNRSMPRGSDVGVRAERLATELACDYDFLYQFFALIGKRIDCRQVGTVGAAWEQIPNPDSRVVLSNVRDKFGLPLADLDWRLTPRERETVRVCALELGKAFARGDIGRVKLDDWVLDDELPLPTLADGAELAGHHHIGTTRMAHNSTTGVVDRNCRVFGVDNLFIAGSSVFSTSGHANPTFTIVQLALRLADHITRLG